MLGSPGGRADDRPRRRRPKSPSARHARPKRPMQTATRFAWPVPPQIGMRDQWRECVNSVEAQRNRSRRLQLPVSVWRQPGSVDEAETDPSSGLADQAWSQRGGADRRASECGDLQGARDQGSRPALARAGNAGARFSLSCPGLNPGWSLGEIAAPGSELTARPRRVGVHCRTLYTRSNHSRGGSPSAAVGTVTKSSGPIQAARPASRISRIICWAGISLPPKNPNSSPATSRMFFANLPSGG